MPTPSSFATPVVALAGGVGAARFLRGLTRAVPAECVTAIVNTGDDKSFYGVHVSPDLDIVGYTLAGLIDRARGWGLAGDRFELIETLASLGHDTWFRLGDLDYAYCLHRTLRLREGVGLAAACDELRRQLKLATRLLPMSEDPCPTLVSRRGGQTDHFEEYLVRDGAPDDVVGVDLSAAGRAKPGPGVLESLRSARTIVLCPSNPVVSIGPILAVPGVREALRESRAPVVAISPIVGGAPIKGPADRLLRGLGVEVSALGVAGLYRDVAQAFVLDLRDAALEPGVRALGLRTCVTDTIMRDDASSQRLAEAALSLAASLS